MKRFVAVAIIGAMLFTAGCGMSTNAQSKLSKSENKGAVGIIADKAFYKVEEKTIKKSDKFLSVDVKYPEYSEVQNKELGEKINKRIQEKIKKDIAELTKESEQLQKDLAGMKDYEARPYDYVVTYSQKANAFGIISIKMDYYYYTGGAHGNTISEVLNYDMKTGEEVSFDKLFKKEGYRQYIEAKIKEKTDELNKKIREENKIEEKDYSVYNFEKLPEKPSYYLDGEKLVIVFGQYEIAPYSEGMPEFSFEKKEIQKYM